METGKWPWCRIEMRVRSRKSWENIVSRWMENAETLSLDKRFSGSGRSRHCSKISENGNCIGMAFASTFPALHLWFGTADISFSHSSVTCTETSWLFREQRERQQSRHIEYANHFDVSMKDYGVTGTPSLGLQFGLILRLTRRT